MAPAKIFESEPARNAKPVSLGDSARLYGQSLIFHKGRYLVRIVAYDESPEVQQGILELRTRTGGASRKVREESRWTSIKLEQAAGISSRSVQLEPSR